MRQANNAPAKVIAEAVIKAAPGEKRAATSPPSTRPAGIPKLSDMRTLAVARPVPTLGANTNAAASTPTINKEDPTPHSARPSRNQSAAWVVCTPT